MSIVQEFKQFVQRGNVVDLAVGVVMGGAFGKIVNSLVADVLTPCLAYFTGGVDFKDLAYEIPKVIESSAPAAVVAYGKFLQATFDFLIIAFCIFMLVKAMNKMQTKQETAPAAPPEPPAQEKLLTEIRDLLKSRS